MNAKKLIGTALSVVLCASMLAGCGNQKNETETTTEKGKKTLVIGDTTFNSSNEENNVNPHDAYSGWACIRYGIGETLVKYSDTMEIEPWLAKEWENVDEDWNISGIKVLNVSDLEVSITDFNGARISFTSNMPVVKVMPQLYVGAGGLAAETEKVFNDLVLLNGDVKDSGITITYTTSRFSYIYDKASQTGTGYMDVLLDEQNIMGTQETYRIFFVC